MSPPATSDPQVTLRAMVRGDLPHLLRWRRQPHVASWFPEARELTATAIEQIYGPRIDGDDPVRMWVVEANGRSVGFVQDYRIGDRPDAAANGADPDDLGVDYAIGEPAWLGRGIGTALLRTWVACVAHERGVAGLFAAADHRNTASRRALLAAGFTEGLWFDAPQPDGAIATMVGHHRRLAEAGRPARAVLG